MNLRHAHPDFPGASCGTMWTQSPRDILVDTAIPLFSAPMIGACWLGLFLTFSGVPVGSATMQASALAVPVKKGTRSKAAARTRAMFRRGILRTVMRSLPQARCLLVSHTANRVSKLRAGLYRRRLVMRSSEREVGAASVRGAAHVAHGVPSDRAGQDICKQSSSMALAIQNLIRAPSAVSGRLRVAAHGRLTAFRAVSGLEGLSVRANNCLS